MSGLGLDKPQLSPAYVAFLGISHSTTEPPYERDIWINIKWALQVHNWVTHGNACLNIYFIICKLYPALKNSQGTYPCSTNDRKAQCASLQSLSCSWQRIRMISVQKSPFIQIKQLHCSNETDVSWAYNAKYLVTSTMREKAQERKRPGKNHKIASWMS